MESLTTYIWIGAIITGMLSIPIAVLVALYFTIVKKSAAKAFQSLIIEYKKPTQELDPWGCKIKYLTE